MKDYEIDCSKYIKFDSIRDKFIKNGFLHLKNILDSKEINIIKESMLNEFVELDNNTNLSEIDQKSLNRCEMPVTHDKCPRINIDSYTAHINSKLPKILETIFAEDFLWHFPPQMRRLSIEKDIGLLPYHQDCYYNNLYENIIVCWTPLSNCGKEAPSLELIRANFKEKFKHTSNEIWEFGIPYDIINEIAKNHEIVSLRDVNINDVVILDAFNLHRTFWEKGMDKIRFSMDLRAVKKSLISEDLMISRKFVLKDKVKFTKGIDEK